MAHDEPAPDKGEKTAKVAREYMKSLGYGEDTLTTTGPLPMHPPPEKKTSRPQIDPARLKRLFAQAVAQAERIHANTEPRVELLVQALANAGKHIPGVESWPIKHTITNNGKSIVTYLEKRMLHLPELEKTLQVACFRFQELAEVAQTSRQVLDESEPDEDLLEQLKRKTYFVANFYDQFKEDPLLRQLFPAPPEASRPKRTAQLGADSITRYRQAREACVKRTEEVLKAIAPGIERARHMMALAKQDRGSALLGLLNPSDLRERTVIRKLREQGRLPVLEETVAVLDRLPGLVAAAREGKPFEPLDAALERLIALHGALAADPTISDLFPPLPDQQG